MSISNSPLTARSPAFKNEPPAQASTLDDLPMFARLRAQAQVYRLRRRQPLPTATPDSVFFVRSGLMTTQSNTPPISRTMVELLYPGDIIAPSLMPQMPGLTYTAITASELWRVNGSALKAEMTNDPALSSYVFQRLNVQRARLQLHITMLAGLTSEQRVAALLLQAAYHLGTPMGTTMTFDMPLSRNEVAEYLALNADTLSRIMSRLVRENVLARSSRAQITIRDLDALKAHCPLSAAVVAVHSKL